MLDILDTAGQEEFSAMRDQYDTYQLVYSLISRSSFNEISSFRDKSYKLKNKYDLESERQVIFNEGNDLASKFGYSFFESSAKTRVNIEEAFFQLVREIRKQSSENVGRNEPKNPERKKIQRELKNRVLL